MSTLKQFTFTLSFASLLGFGNLIVTNPSQAFTLTAFGDVLRVEDTIYLSTNGLNEEDSGLDNLVGNAYNFSGNPAIDARDLESFLGLSSGQLDPNPPFVQATQGSGAILNLSVPNGTRVTLEAKFFTNDSTFTNEAFVYDDFAFIIQNGRVRRIANTNSAETTLIPSTTILPSIDRLFLRESPSFLLGNFSTGEYQISLGIVDIGDEERTSNVLFKVTSQPDKIPEPSTILGLKQAFALIFLAFLSRKFLKVKNRC